MMLRADLVTNKMTIVALFGGLLLLIFCLPRIPLLFGVNYEEWAISYGSTYSPTIVNTILSFAALLYFYLYLNKKVVHSSPITFATLPASLWEKITNILLYALILQLLARLSSFGGYVLERLTNPHTTPFDVADIMLPNYAVLEHIEIIAINPLNILIGIAWTAAILGYYLLPFYLVLRMRNGFVALFVAAIVAGLIILILSLAGTLTAAFSLDFAHTLLYTEEQLYSTIYAGTALVTSLIVALTAGLGYLSIHKLKTISS